MGFRPSAAQAGIEDDAELLLRHVYEMLSLADRSGHDLSTSAIAKRLNFTPKRLNAAISWATSKHWMECDESLGSAVYTEFDTASVWLSEFGKVYIERLIQLEASESAAARKSAPEVSKVTTNEVGFKSRSILFRTSSDGAASNLRRSSRTSRMRCRKSRSFYAIRTS